MMPPGHKVISYQMAEANGGVHLFPGNLVANQRARNSREAPLYLGNLVAVSVTLPLRRQSALHRAVEQVMVSLSHAVGGVARTHPPTSQAGGNRIENPILVVIVTETKAAVGVEAVPGAQAVIGEGVALAARVIQILMDQSRDI